MSEARSSAQAEIVRRLTPAQKLAAALQLYRSARALKESWLRSRHPDWSPKRVRDEVRRSFLLHGE